jgi:hypothetical protein
MKTFPTVDVWRRRINDKKASTIADKLWWDAVLSLIRVEGRHEDFKLVYLKIRGLFVDPIVNKNILLNSIVPYNRFLFGTAPT